VPRPGPAPRDRGGARPGQLRTVAGGEFAGDLADGVIKPNLPKDYAPSGIWDTLLGSKVPTPATPRPRKALIASPASR
jgi:peptide/nickel transport system substrate-binding protein